MMSQALTFITMIRRENARGSVLDLFPHHQVHHHPDKDDHLLLALIDQEAFVDHLDPHLLVQDDPCMVVHPHRRALGWEEGALHPFLPWGVVHLLPFLLDNSSSRRQVHTLLHRVDIDKAGWTIARLLNVGGSGSLTWLYAFL